MTQHFFTRFKPRFNTSRFSLSTFIPSKSFSSSVNFKEIAQHIKESDGLYITCGAGMSVDSGLPDFRGKEGFWKAYPPLKKLGISNIIEMANPEWFDINPNLAWGFYGHRLHLYANTTPHNGYNMLKSMGQRLNNGYFVFTSNVDNHFISAGFNENNIVECHGNINYFQCLNGNCGTKLNCKSLKELNEIRRQNGINTKIEDEIVVNHETITVKDEMIPKCLEQLVGNSENCRYLKNKFFGNSNLISRPNILMFGDYGFKSDRVMTQYRNKDKWMKNIKNKITVIEIGAGLTVPTIRYESESVTSKNGIIGVLVRINVREPQISNNYIKHKYSIPLGGLESIQSIFDEFKKL